MYTNNRILLQTNMFNLEKVEIMKKVFYKSLILAFYLTKLLQKSEMRKDIVIELSYRGFSCTSDYS